MGVVMSKLYFYFGAMNSSKSASLLMNVHNYESQGKNVLILKPSKNIRDSEGVVSSRVGISHLAIEVSTDKNIVEILEQNNNSKKIDCIFVDEVHMFTVEQIRQLVYIVDKLNINIITYGLKNSYVSGKVFEPIQELLFQANSIYEIKSTCNFCNSKATHNLRVVDSKPVYDGEMINCGDTKPTSDYYIPVCRKHYYNPVL